MTNQERDELLIRIDERIGAINNKLERDYKVLHGNGQPGLISRVQSLENQHKTESKHIGAIAAVIAFGINGILAIYAIFKN